MGRGARGTAAQETCRTPVRSHQIVGLEHQVFTVKLGVIDDTSVAAFTTGQCHALALAMHERTGWPLYGCQDDTGDYNHFFVMTPDGRALDISGCYDLDDYEDQWPYDHVPLSADEVRESWQDGTMREPDLRAARTYVDETLLYVSGEKPNHVSSGEVASELAQTMAVVNADGDRVRVNAGVIDENAKDLFRFGQDHALARMLALRGDLKGARMHVLRDDDFEVSHCYVLLADGRAVNIDGVHDHDELIAQYGGSPEPVNYRKLESAVEDDGRRPPADDAAAGTFIEAVLAQINARTA